MVQKFQRKVVDIFVSGQDSAGYGAVLGMAADVSADSTRTVHNERTNQYDPAEHLD